MLSSLYAAVSGLTSNQKSMDVIGNNIANVNTIGYKTGRAVFQDLMSYTLSSGKSSTDSTGGINPRQVGMGSYLVAVDNIFSQGVIQSTSDTNDLAISGDGFFVVRGSGSSQYYTRAGDFHFDTSGNFVNPSGYIAQGWMVDPTTGILNTNTTAGDITLTDAHKVMQAKATSQIQYAGALNNSATASTVTFPTMLTQAGNKLSIYDVLTTNGVNLGLSATDTITVAAHATAITDMGQIYTSGGQATNLSLFNTSNVTFTVTDSTGVQSTHTFLYGSADNASANTFNTVQGLLDCIATAVPSSASVGISNGAISISSSSADTFTIDSITSTSTYMANLLNGLETSYAGQTRTSDALYFQKSISVADSISDLGDLATQVERAISGNVVANFTADYLENDFGLLDGDEIQIPISTDGGLTYTTMTFTYKEYPSGSGEFNTVAQLASEIQSQLAAAGLSTGDVTVTSIGDKLNIQMDGGTSATLTFGTVQSYRPNTGSYGVSNYIEDIFNQTLDGNTYNSTNSLATTESISGKGRIVYNNNDSTGQSLTGFTITTANSNDIFADNVLTSNVISAGSSGVSEMFLTTATEDTLLRDVFTESGVRAQFTEDTSYITFNATVDGSKITTDSSFIVEVNSTVGDMMDALEEYLGLGATHDNKDNVVIENGKIKVTGEKGTANNIDALTLVGHPESQLSGSFNVLGTPASTTAATGGRFTTSMTIYDEQGSEHLVNFDFYYSNEQKNEWVVKVSTTEDGSSVSVNGATSNELTIRFNSDGTINYIYDASTDPIQIISNPSINFVTGNGAGNITDIALNFGTAGTTDGLYLANTTTNMTTQTQDGYTVGALEATYFNEAGELIAYYTNNQYGVIGQIALATFANNQGLSKAGDSLYQATEASGEATIGTPGTSGRGVIASSSLEQSNVDLTTEFVNMITTQRAYQSNSRVITTSDEMLQELLSLKR